MAGRGTTREAAARLRVDGTKVPSDLRKGEGKFKRGGDRAGKAFAKGFKRQVRRLKSIAGLASGAGLVGAAGIGAAFGLGLRDAAAFEQSVENISVQIEASAQQTEELRKQMTDVSKATGIDRGEFAKGVEVLADKIGAAGVTEEQITLLGRAMQASGGDATTLASLMQTLQVTLGQTGKEAEASLSRMLAIGKAASIPLSDLAESAPSLISIAKQSSVGADELSRLVATAQRLQPVFGDSGKAATALEQVLQNIGNQGKEIKKTFKVKVFEKGADGVVRQRKAFEILREILPKIAKDGRLVTKAFGRRKEIGTALRALADPQVQSEIDGLIARGNNVNQIMEDIERRNASPATQLKKSINDLKLAFAEAFTPDLIRDFAAGLRVLASAAKDLVEFLKDAKDLLFDEDRIRSEGDEFFERTYGMGGTFNDAGRVLSDAGVDVPRYLTRDTDLLNPASAAVQDGLTRDNFFNTTAREFERIMERATRNALRKQPVAVKGAAGAGAPKPPNARAQ